MTYFQVLSVFQDGGHVTFRTLGLYIDKSITVPFRRRSIPFSIVLHSCLTELGQIFQSNTEIQERGIHRVETRTFPREARHRTPLLIFGHHFPAPFILDLRQLSITSRYIFRHRLTVTSTVIVILPSQNCSLS